MLYYPKISIVTPSYNQGMYLEETILSIVSQNYPNLEYIIIDGGSTDGSVEIIQKYSQYITYWVSEKDDGLYHALQKGFNRSSGEIMGWLNSDDMLHRKSLFLLAAIFNDLPQINWLQGRPTIFNEASMTVSTNQPYYSKYHFYLKKYKNGPVFIQQESSYWRRTLWEKAGSNICQEYKLAGDFELWMRFFNYDFLYHTEALIGGYRVRKSQLSRDFHKEYLEECDKIIDQLSLNDKVIARLKLITFYERYIIKIKILRSLFKGRYDRLFEYYPPITFDFASNKFCF